MIYAFLNQKDGVGKTTLSIHTAAELSRRGRRVLLIGADQQGSALACSNGRDAPTFTVVGMPKATLHKEIDLLIADYDDVVIDGPPRFNGRGRRCRCGPLRKLGVLSHLRWGMRRPDPSLGDVFKRYSLREWLATGKEGVMGEASKNVAVGDSRQVACRYRGR